MLKTEYLVAKIGVETAENGPSKVVWSSGNRSGRLHYLPQADPRVGFIRLLLEPTARFARLLQGEGRDTTVRHLLPEKSS